MKPEKVKERFELLKKNDDKGIPIEKGYITTIVISRFFSCNISKHIL